MCGALPPLPQYAFMVWCSVKKHRENFTFDFTFTFLGNCITFNYAKIVFKKPNEEVLGKKYWIYFPTNASVYT
jgi:hypothetical protein